MSFLAQWKKAFAATFVPLPLIALIMTVGLSIATTRFSNGGGWQILFLVFAAVAASFFGGLVVQNYNDCPSPLALKAESADEMIGVVRGVMKNPRKSTPMNDRLLSLAQKELRRNGKIKRHE
jgi:hypothetical protein